MVSRYRFIAIEGIDGAGKRTQLALLARWLARRRVPCARWSFPQYGSFFGRMVGQFLDGAFGALGEVDPHFSALLYAANRFEARERLRAALASGRLVIADRYIGSNLAHQTARVPRAHQAAFLAWLRELEYGAFALPRESLVVYLRLPAAEAQRLVARKAARAYTRRQHDLQEASLRHLREAAAVYDRLARQRNWITVECVHHKGGGLKPPATIHRELVAAIERRGRRLMRT
jgi:dTMP kinase